MNRNQKIALGCGGGGCLALIVVVIAGGLIYFFAYRRVSQFNRDYNFNVSTNRNSNTNDNSDFTTNKNNNSSNSSSASTSTMSEDEKHKLYQAATMTGDEELTRRVSVKVGLMNEDYTPGADYKNFIAQHIGWAIHNTDFIRSINTPERARAYVNEHFPE